MGSYTERNGVAIVLFDKFGRVLMLKRSENSKNGGGKYNLPGGKVEEGESPEEAAIREFREETGIELPREELREVATITRFYRDKRYGNIPVIHRYVVYRARIDDVEPRLSDEHSEYQWVPTSNGWPIIDTAFPHEPYAIKIAHEGGYGVMALARNYAFLIYYKTSPGYLLVSYGTGHPRTVVETLTSPLKTDEIFMNIAILH